MGKGSEFPLSITLRTVDKATSGIKRVNDELDKAFGPFRKLSKELGALGENAGLAKLGSGFRGIGKVVRELGQGVAVVGGAAAAAVFGFKHLSDEFDNLGDKAEEIGIGVDALAQLRYAAGQSGGEVSALDSSLGAFNKNLGLLSAGKGKFRSFLKTVSPALYRQVKAAKSTEEAFGLIGDAMAKLKAPGKKEALAAAAGIDPSMIPLLAKGRKGIAELQAEYARVAGSQQDAADAAGNVDSEWRLMGAAIQRVKASIVASVGPAFAELTRSVTDFLTAHQAEIGAWLRDFGQKLPDRIERLGEFLSRLWSEDIKPVVQWIGAMVDKVGGAENAIKLLMGAFIAFKAIQTAGHLAEIVSGLVGIATAAAKAIKVLQGVGAAANAASAASAVVSGGAGVGATTAAGAVGSGSVIGGLGSSLSAVSAGTIAAGVAAAAAAGVGVGMAADWATGKWSESGRSISDRLAGSDVGGTQLFDRGTLRLLTHAGMTGAADVGSPAAAQAQAKVTIELENAPKGTRVTTDPTSNADVDLSVGYQMMGW